MLAFAAKVLLLATIPVLRPGEKVVIDTAGMRVEENKLVNYHVFGYLRDMPPAMTALHSNEIVRSTHPFWDPNPAPLRSRSTSIRRINYGANAEAALSGFLAVHNLKGDAAAGAYYGRVLAPLTKAAIVDLDPDGAAYRALLKDDRTGEFFEKDVKYTTYRPKDSAPPPWNSDDRLVSGPLRFGGHVSAGSVNALVQMAPEYASAADWVRANATKMLHRIAKAHLTHLEDPHGLYRPSCYWNTHVRSGDALGFWLWAYWTLRSR